MFIFPAIGFGQGVAINNDNSLPNNNAILDVKSVSKGVLLPRLTTAQRLGIVSAIPGLTVFDSETFSYWVYLGDLNGGWTELLSSLNKHWDVNGSIVYNTNLGNVGIGTSNPSQKLAINATDPTIDFMNAGTSKGFLQAKGNDIKLGTYFNNTNGNLVFNTKAVDRMWINDAGNVGIGTSSPSSALTINGSNPWIQMRTNNVDKGYLWASGSDLRLGTSLTNTTGKLALQTKLQTRIIIDETGRVAIGTATPASSTIFTINDSDPLIQIQNNGTGKGFLQVLGNDMKIGTNTSNLQGNFIIRTAGTDKVSVSRFGDVGIGINFTNYKLDVIGTTKLDGDVFVKGKTESESLKIIEPGFTSSGNIYLDNEDNLKITKAGVNTGGIVLDANVSNGSKRLYVTRYNHLNFGTGLTPQGYTASVEGKVIATEFTTLAIPNWPDYVFADDYKLKSLDEVKSYIAENNHLPNIPSAKEIEKYGVQLGDMSKKLIEKVEELTLYVIQLNEQNKLLQEQINEIKPLNKTN